MTVQINQPSTTLSGTTSSSRVAYPGSGSRQNGLYVYNSGAVLIYVKSGDSSVVAAAGDSFVLPGTARSFMKNTTDTHVATITASSTATVYVQEEPFF